MALFTGCHRYPLSCRSEYLYPDYLASERILTPDPYKNCFYGQQIVIHWALPRGQIADELKLDVRYGTRELASFSWSIPLIRGRWGYQIYRIINDEYWCREGIVAYQAKLFAQGEPIAYWTHHLWAEIISLSP